jgi:nucleoside-diphosphate-sugar epimerase
MKEKKCKEILMIRLPKRLTLEMAERIIADAIMINISLMAAFLLRLILLSIIKNRDPNTPIAFLTALWKESIRAYRNSAWLLTLICILIFYLSGFYTYGRAYRSRYKALLIFQAVSISYLLFGFFSYFLPPLTPFPRSVLTSSWIFSIILVGGLRVWSALWRRATWAEAPIWGKPNRRPICNVSVIGGAGYIGSILTRKLLDHGYHVTVLDALIYGDDSIRDLYGRPHFELIHGDLRNIEAVIRSMQFADAVIHLGALVGDPVCSLNEKLTLEINLAATRMIAEAARGVGVQRFIFASTCSVYGASDQILDERSALNPISLYARTKMESERILLNFNDRNFAPVILRFGTIYGLSPRPRFDLVINLLAAQATCEKRITIYGGNQWRPFVHVDDAAEAIMRCLEAPIHAIKGQIFNVGCDDQNYMIVEIGQIIKDIIPEVQVIHEGDEKDKRNYRVSFEKIRKQLGFVPRRTVVDGIKEIKLAIESGLIRDYRAAHYSNYKTLKDEDNAVLIRTVTINLLYEPAPKNGDTNIF